MLHRGGRQCWPGQQDDNWGRRRRRRRVQARTWPSRSGQVSVGQGTLLVMGGLVRLVWSGLVWVTWGVTVFKNVLHMIVHYVTLTSYDSTLSNSYYIVLH